MDVGTLLNVIWTAGAGLIAITGWLFKLHGNVGILRERLNSEIELRKAMESRLNGFEQRIYDKLDEILEQLSRKADR